MEKFLELKIDVGGGAGSAPFPNAENPIEISSFRYEAKRMGGAPTITASVNYPSCLDDVWTDRVYAEFNGEKYYLKQTPTSSFSNEDNRYKHNIELISERAILDDVYFFDVVTGNPQGDDKPVSNSSKVIFFGNIHEFVIRLNASLQYSNLDYVVIVDDDVKTEDKLVSFEDQFFSNVLQEIYKTYEVPYYFDGKIIRIGYSKEGVDIPDLEYGVDNALLSITKNNANYKIVNRATGFGSSENIPFYYPNNSPKGEIAATCSSPKFTATILDAELYSDKVKLDGAIKRTNIGYENVKVTHVDGKEIYSGNSFSAQMGYGGINKYFSIKFDAKDAGELSVTFKSDVIKYTLNDVEINDATFAIGYRMSLYSNKNKKLYSSNNLDSINNILVPIAEAGTGYKLEISVVYAPVGKYSGKGGRIVYNASYNLGSDSGWVYDGKPIELKDVGLKVDGNTSVGDTITQTLVKYVKTSSTLLPSIYRETDGANRFYNAVNETYPFEFVDGYELKDGEYVGEDGMVHHPDHYEYKNPFVEGRPKEHIVKVDDIKPTIEGVVNSMGLRMDMFSEFAYDDDDNDETLPEDDSSDRKFLHAYFFGKLRKLDFNLFDHAIEQQPMTISFTSGDCGACKFAIGVTEEFPQKNPVQVDENGNLVRDENGRVVCGQFAPIKESQCQPKQQDTINNEVWIALKKEEETYGVLMPKAPKFNEAGEQIEVGHRPKACDKGENNGDTFAVLGIHLPKPYILNAEKNLENEIIRYLQDNNEEKFTFDINFSRIYFAENEDILKSLNENSKVNIIYDNKPYSLYVSSFSYNMSEGDILPDIKVTLDDTLKVSSNAIRNAINEVKSSIGNTVNEIAREVAMQRRSYVSRVEDDNAQGVVNFTKGIMFGEGGKVDVLDENSAKLTIDYLEVTKKASFTSIEIQEKTHVGGQILVTPAAITCNRVDEFNNYYRCYFQISGENGDEIFNQFAINDQAICQTYNSWESKYYWRLVVGIGRDYIDLSKTDCDEDSGVPSAGDKIIQLGNRDNDTRQDAIVIAAYGDGSPYIIQYKGINSFDLADDKIITKMSATENIFTGKVHMEMGSSIPEEVLGDLSGTIEDAIGGLEFGKYNLLRNSGFTGDFVTEALDNGSVLDENDEMFSDPLRHWITEGNVAVIDSESSQSGKECRLLGSSLKQEMMYPIIEGENYVLSFRARGRNLTYSVGGVTKTIALTGKQSRVIEKFTATSGGNMFAITNATATICEIQLERGNVVSAWGHSMWDNQSEIAKYQALNYLESAIKNGSTDILGGLIMSNILLLGNPQAGDNTAGVSGIRNDDNDVAFWGGGTFSQAIATVMKYVEDPNYQHTDEDVASMAKAVITHGGRAILNDIILRGKVYATGGRFQGAIDIDAKEVNGRVVIDDNGFVYYGTDGDEGEYPRVALGATCQAASGVFLAPKADAQFCTSTALLAVGDDTHRALQAQGDALVTGNLRVDGESTQVQNLTVKKLIPNNISEVISIPFGTISGLRPYTRTDDGATINLSSEDHTVIIPEGVSGKRTINLPQYDDSINGQEYRIISASSVAIDLNIPLRLRAYSLDAGVAYAGGSAISFSASRRDITLILSDGTWYMSHYNHS